MPVNSEPGHPLCPDYIGGEVFRGELFIECGFKKRPGLTGSFHSVKLEFTSAARRCLLSAGTDRAGVRAVSDD